MKLRRFAILSSVFVCFSSGPAIADSGERQHQDAGERDQRDDGHTLVVDNDLQCPHAKYRSIQLAVVDAKPGDKILVCPGTYYESVLITTLQSHVRIQAQAARDEKVVLRGTSAQLAGFYLLNTTGVLVEGFTVEGFGTPFVTPDLLSQGANIRIEGGSGNTLRKNVTKDSLVGNGIQVINSSANVVEQNSSFDNLGPFSDGIELSGELSFENIIRRNETFRNGQIGINIVGPMGLDPTRPGNVVFGNRSYQNARIGIRNVSSTGAPAGGAHRTVIENNHVSANGTVPAPVPPPIMGGILVGASHDVIIRNNRSEENHQFGIRLQNGATNNLVEKNEVSENSEDGILLQNNADLNIVQLNIVERNGRDGIRIFEPASERNTIERNVIRKSGEHDAHDDGAANVWINNKCETENRPGLCEHRDR
jgi:parallel beta-helix repeat protein